MSNVPVTLPRPLINQLLHYAQLTPEAEICGLIGAGPNGAYRCYPVPNAAADPARRFELDPAGQIEAIRLMRERGESLFAIFHSHPSAPAEPSPADFAEASHPEALYLIISLNTKGVLEMRGFRLDDDKRFAEIALSLSST
ncbi:Mov34/MPN/PAD-1 family protein [Methylococcus sp. EFPC2]|uniref:Mov34/MPN/PAD-1 family protein n=1 Tax=Methylococcus sp. EFPC2 TaxID=2812648 RepID=UPI00196700F2|nr:M67 family metallopeptidase [Methylococcus sp. EFPC2]QSA96871.1 M67 family metallopeptidase [Methylococcus sp. EFPC2]